MDCGDPGTPTFGSHDALLRTTYEATVSYFCQPGYLLRGGPERLCLDNGQWSGYLPTCIGEQQKTGILSVSLGTCTQARGFKGKVFDNYAVTFIGGWTTDPVCMRVGSMSVCMFVSCDKGYLLLRYYLHIL